MRHNKNRTALMLGTGLALMLLLGITSVFACGDYTPDPASTPPVVLVLAI